LSNRNTYYVIGITWAWMPKKTIYLSQDELEWVEQHDSYSGIIREAINEYREQ